jgi:hypothetical protein
MASVDGRPDRRAEFDPAAGRPNGEWIAATASLVHDLTRLYEAAVIEDGGGAPRSVSFRPQRSLPDFPLVTRAAAYAFALHMAGEMLWRIGGEPLVGVILAALEAHYGLPAALMVRSAWGDLPGHGRQG